MIRKIVTALILVPLAILIVMFAVANRDVVTVSFDPFNAAQPASAVKLPLFALLITATMAGVLVGGIAAWLKQAKWRRAARLLEGDIQGLRREIEALNARLDGAGAAPPLDAARIPYRPPAA
jgi:uncharacterized integral membrane protein